MIDWWVREIDRLLKENVKLREFARELAYGGVEYDAGKYLVIQVDPTTRHEAHAFFNAEKETKHDA